MEKTTYTREDIEQCKPSDRPLVRATIPIEINWTIHQRIVMGSILITGNNPTVIASYKGESRHTTISWGLLLAVLNDPSERPIELDAWSENPIVIGG